MTTVKNCFDMAMSIADELSTTGTVVAADTNEYLYRSYGILNLLQAELVRTGDLFTTYELDKTDEPFASVTTAKSVEITMPTDFSSIEDVSVRDEYGNIYACVFKWRGRNTMIVSSDIGENTLVITYRPVPALVTASTDNLTVDDITARTLLPYALCAELFKEENEYIYNHCMARVKEIKAENRKKAMFADITDVYGW